MLRKGDKIKRRKRRQRLQNVSPQQQQHVAAAAAAAPAAAAAGAAGGPVDGAAQAGKREKNKFKYYLFIYIFLMSNQGAAKDCEEAGGQRRMQVKFQECLNRNSEAHHKKAAQATSAQQRKVRKFKFWSKCTLYLKRIWEMPCSTLIFSPRVGHYGAINWKESIDTF